MRSMRRLRKYSALNDLTVEEFLEIYSESVQDKMSEIGYYVQDGLICID